MEVEKRSVPSAGLLFPLQSVCSLSLPFLSFLPPSLSPSLFILPLQVSSLSLVSWREEGSGREARQRERRVEKEKGKKERGAKKKTGTNRTNRICKEGEREREREKRERERCRGRERES